jgi:cytochrome c oxidase cbb3-type subunit 1
MEGLMWRAYNQFGFLEYSFIETVSAKHISYIIRALGGGLYLTGALIMAYNLVRTARGDVPADERRRSSATPAIQPAE